MCGVQKTMKLKVRVAILACSALSFCAIFLALNQFPTLYDGKLRSYQPRLEQNIDEFVDQPHFIAFRKRLNKSNYTSENISPEMGKRTAEVKTVLNDTLEYSNKDISDSAHINPDIHEYHTNKGGNKSYNNGYDLEYPFNETDKYVDKMLYLLQSSNGLKFNFEKTRFVPYKNFIKLQTKRLRRKGMGLPIYRNYRGG